MVNTGKSRITFHIEHPEKTNHIVDLVPTGNKVIANHQIDNYPVKQSTTRKNWVMLLVSVLSAIVSGVVLGFYILTFFKENQSGTNEMKQLPSLAQSAQQQSSELMIQLPELNFYGLQYGVFSTMENARKARAEVIQSTSEEVPATILAENNGFHLYVGLTANAEEARKSAESLDFLKIKLMVKPLNWNKEKLLVGDKITALEGKGLLAARELIYLMITANEKVNTKKINEKHQLLLEILEKNRRNATTSTSVFPESQIKRLEAAFLSWQEFQNHPHPQRLREIQAQALEYLSNEKK